MPVLDTTQTTANAECLCYSSSSVSLICATDLANCSFNSKHTHLTIATLLIWHRELFSPLKITQFHQSRKKAKRPLLKVQNMNCSRKKSKWDRAEEMLGVTHLGSINPIRKKIVKMSSEKSSLWIKNLQSLWYIYEEIFKLGRNFSTLLKTSCIAYTFSQWSTCILKMLFYSEFPKLPRLPQFLWVCFYIWFFNKRCPKLPIS